MIASFLIAIVFLISGFVRILFIFTGLVDLTYFVVKYQSKDIDITDLGKQDKHSVYFCIEFSNYLSMPITPMVN